MNTLKLVPILLGLVRVLTPLYPPKPNSLFLANTINQAARISTAADLCPSECRI